MERKLGAFGLADYYSQRRIKRATKLDALHAAICWEPLEKKLKNALGRSDAAGPGVQAYPAIMMFKILLLQRWYNLSDAETEESLLDRVSFARFVGLSFEDTVPDHTTICRFRNLLAEKKVMQILLQKINWQLEKQGKLLREGVAVDASIIESAARPRKTYDLPEVQVDRQEDETEQKPLATLTYSHDTDAAWLKKGKKFHYGYKLHAAAETRDGFVLGGHMTPANASDTGQFRQIIDETPLPEKAWIYGDKGYTSKSNSQHLEDKKLRDGIMSRAWRNRELSSDERARNRKISESRYIVERVFGTLKRCYGLARSRYIGLAKVENEFLLAAVAYNLKRSLYVLAPQGA
ncbi:MAG: IS5 family transposase [Alphaproteobacteria bacterium]